MVHVDKEIYKQFKLLSAAQLATTDLLMHDALDLLFQYYTAPKTLRRRLSTSGVALAKKILTAVQIN